MAQDFNESIRFIATAEDRGLLEELARQDGDASMSATIRRLIRAEAQRREIRVPVKGIEPDGMLTA